MGVGVVGGVGVGIGGVGRWGVISLMSFADVQISRVMKTFSTLFLFFFLRSIFFVLIGGLPIYPCIFDDLMYIAGSSNLASVFFLMR